MLNVEQYENVPVYNQNTGIKIHMHIYDDVPQVADSGFTAAPGYQTLAPLDYQTAAYLPPPWGRCSSQAYEFFNSTDRYTTAKCQLECKTRSVLAKCGCKDVYMPGPSEICSLHSYLSCIGSSNDQSLCSCPDECFVFSYATSLSISQLSGVGLESTLWNTDSIRESYWHSLEIANRVDDTVLMQTILGLESVILSHGQLKTLIYKNILNSATSVTSFVLKAVGKLMEIMENDIDSSQRLFDQFQECYGDNVTFLVQSISDQMNSVSEELSNLTNSAQLSMSTEEHESVTNVLESVKQTLSSVSDSLSKFCPANFTVKKCPMLMSDINDIIDALLILMSTKQCPTSSSATTGSTIGFSIVHGGSTTPTPSAPSTLSTSATSSSSTLSMFTTLFPSSIKASQACDEFSEEGRFLLIKYLLSNMQLKLSDVLSCMTDYSDLLKTFQFFLDSVDRTVSTVDMASATRSLNILLQDASWLEDLMVAYQNGSLTKLRLSDEFLEESSSRLLLHVENALSGVETSVLSDVTSVINVIETRIISVYPQLIAYLYNLKTFMAYNDTTVDSFARDLLLWRSPIPMLQDKTIAGFQLTSDQIEQVIGADVTLTALVNSSATIVPMIVRAFDSNLKQTLTNVQLELSAAQHVVIDSVNNLNHQLISFNDSTFIGDNFVRNNFMQVDIFYGELKYRTFQQTTGYDLVQFLSDFGGCFGLFLGGSILSFFEFLDLLIYNLIVKLTSRKIGLMTKRINIRPKSDIKDPRPQSGVKVHSFPANGPLPLETVMIK